VVQADGTYKADPDLATLTLIFRRQDKESATTYRRAVAGNAKYVHWRTRTLAKERRGECVADLLLYYEATEEKAIPCPGNYYPATKYQTSASPDLDRLCRFRRLVPPTSPQ